MFQAATRVCIKKQGQREHGVLKEPKEVHFGQRGTSEKIVKGEAGKRRQGALRK